MRLCGHETFGSSLCRDIDVRLALEVVKRVALHSVAVVLNFRFAPLLVLSGSLPLIKLGAVLGRSPRKAGGGFEAVQSADPSAVWQLHRVSEFTLR